MKTILRKNARFNYILCLYLAGMVLFTLFRLVETAVYCAQTEGPDDFGGLYGTALWKGFRFDTAVSAYVLALPLLLIIVGEMARIRKRWYYAIAHYTAMVLYTVCFFACAADIPYFCYFFARLDAAVLTMGSSLGVVADMIISEPTYLVYLGVFIAIAEGWWQLGRLIYRRILIPHLDDTLPYPWSIPLAALLLLGWFTSMRGHLTKLPPLRAENSVYCSNPFLNQIGLNPVFTFMKSAGAIMSEQRHPLELIDLKTARQEYAAQQALPLADGDAVTLPEGTHVVLVIMESMAVEKTSLSSHPETSLTPCLDSLMRQGITFTELYSAGTQTFNGVYSTLYSHPAIFKQQSMRAAIMPHMCGLPHQLQAAGYSTAYFMPHKGYFDSMEGFLFSNGYDKVFEEGSYPKEEIINSYGVPDHILFRHALEYIGEAVKQGPSFTTIMTCSDHPPYVVPTGIGFTPTRSDILEQVVQYADWSIGQFMAEASRQPWFGNTVFVFVADHGCPDKNPVYDIPLTRNRIPLIIYAPGRIEPKFIDRIALQIDVAPTILGMLGLGTENKLIGIDVIKHRRQYAAFGSGDMIGAVDGELLYIYRHGDGRTTLHRYKEYDPKDVSDQYPDRKEAMGRYALSMVQISHQMLKEGTTACDK